MPLIQTVLETELSKVLNSEDSSFLGFSDSPSIISDRLATAIDIYGSQVIPASSSYTASKSAAQGIFLGINAPNTAIDLIPAGVQTYVNTLAPGMVSAGFNGVPPAGLVDINPLLNRPFSVPYQAGENMIRINILATQIHNYFLTGTAININSGAVVPWT